MSDTNKTAAESTKDPIKPEVRELAAKLTLTIETDGTVTPEDAVAYAGRILQDQLALFVHFDDSAITRSSAPIGQAAAPAAGGETAGDTQQINRYPGEYKDASQAMIQRIRDEVAKA